MENKVWIKYYADGVLNETITFSDIKEKIHEKIKLLEEKGLRNGDRVVVKMNNSIDVIINYLALSESNMITVPVNPKDSKVRIDFIIKDCKPNAVIEEDGSILIINKDNDKKRDDFKLKNINTLIYTSGTTGDPKGVCLSLDNWKSNADSLIKHHNLNGKTILATPLPIFHCNAHGLGMYTTYYSKSTLILFDKVPKNFLEIINDEKVNIVSIVPVILKKLFDSNSKFRAHKDFNYFLTAATPLSGDLLENILKIWKIKVIQGYGLTESTNFSCTVPIDLDEDTYKKVMLPNPSIGVELSGVDIVLRKIGESDQKELFIKSKSNSLGYWNKDISERELVDTGDIGYCKIINGKRYYYLRGRTKNLINRGGEKIYPLELESEIRDLGLTNEIHVIAILNEDFGEEVAIVTLDKFDFSILEKIPYFRRPKKVFKVDDFCKTSTGKIQRAKMMNRCDDLNLIWKYERRKN